MSCPMTTGTRNCLNGLQLKRMISLCTLQTYFQKSNSGTSTLMNCTQIASMPKQMFNIPNVRCQISVVTETRKEYPLAHIENFEVYYLTTLRVLKLTWCCWPVIEWLGSSCEMNYPEKYLSQCKTIYHKSHIKWRGFEPGWSFMKVVLTLLNSQK
jgi:hypothetical protein